MFDVDTQVRFNKSCTEAMVNYFNASGAAYQSIAHQMLRMWGQSVDAMVEGAQQTPPANPMQMFQQASASRSGGFDCMMPWAAIPNAMMVGSNPMASFMPFGSTAAYGMYSPFAQWMEMMQPKNSTAWPMAVGMISFGVPEQVAWPTARGNAAALDAFGVASKSVEKALSASLANSTSKVEPTFSRIEESRQNPFSVAFAVMPFDPAALMQFFIQNRPR